MNFSKILIAVLLSICVETAKCQTEQSISQNPAMFSCDDFEIVDQALLGSINSKKWKFKSGFATRTLILLFNNNVISCDPHSLSNSDYVRINIKPTFEPGLYDLQNPEDAHYVIDVKNIKDGIACYGCLACGELSIKINDRTEALTGEIHAQWLDGDFVNGKFSIPLCFDFETK